MSRAAICLAALLCLAGCTGSPPPAQTESLGPLAQVDTSAWPAPVGEVALRELAEVDLARALSVSIVLFDDGLPEDASSLGARGVFPDIRRTETRYLPVLLRRALVTANAWGPVRVIPEPDSGAELQLRAQILHSDGQYLVLQVRAEDASGRVWLDRVYSDRAREADYPVVGDDDPFVDLYHQVANDLLAARDKLSTEALQRLRQTAELRYASTLAPDAFAGYLGRDAEQRYTLQRLPAENDPMLSRILRLRDQEHRFIDTVDEQYLDLLEEVRPTYNLWRQYGLEQAQYIEDYQARLATRDSAGRRGTFAALQQTYNAFKWSKIQQQDLRELAGGFNNEVAPTVMDVSGRVFRLSGSLASQYTEWQGILREIFRLETGLPAPG